MEMKTKGLTRGVNIYVYVFSNCQPVRKATCFCNRILLKKIRFVKNKIILKKHNIEINKQEETTSIRRLSCS